MDADVLGERVVKRYKASGIDSEIMGRACGVRAATVASWGTDRLPRGVVLNAAWHILAIAGADSPELAEIPELGYTLGRLLALQVLSLQDVMDICGLRNEQGALRVTRGDQDPLRPSWTAADLERRYGEERTAAETKLRESLGMIRAAADTGGGRGPDEQYLAQVAAQIGALLPALTYLLSEAVSPADRARLRELAGPTTVFQLGTALAALNSQRALNELRDDLTGR